MDELCQQLERTVVTKEDNIRANLQQLFDLYRTVDRAILTAAIRKDLHDDTVYAFQMMIVHYLVFKKSAEGTAEIPPDSNYIRVYDDYLAEPKLEVYFDVSKSSVDPESLDLNNVYFEEFDPPRQIAFYCRGGGYMFSLLVSVK